MKCIRSSRRVVVAATLALLPGPGALILRGAATVSVPGEDTLKTLENPGGGRIVFGTLPQGTSFGGGMGLLLRNVHGHFGDRPTVGKFFRVRDSDSVAAFFNLADQHHGGKRISGLAIVSIPPEGRPAAAVLYDDAERFPRTQPAMMRRLGEAWHGAGPVASAPPSGAAIPTLRMATGGDRSATIGLPEGWRLTGVAGGQLTAEGGKGDMVYLGVLYQQIHDPRMPQPRVPTIGGGGRPLVCAFGGDLFAAFVSVSNQVRRNRQLPQGAYRLVSTQNLPATQYEKKVIQAIYEVDLQDGHGLRKASARIGAMATRGIPTWAMTVSGSSAPKTVADTEAPIIMAVIHSYSQDPKVIAGEANAVIGQIHANAKASQIRAKAQSDANDAKNQAFDAHMDDLDRNSKSFQNYQLDRAQVQDNDQSLRGTVSNAYADSLVQADPKRFQIVPTQDFLKGVDY